MRILITALFVFFSALEARATLYIMGLGKSDWTFSQNLLVKDHVPLTNGIEIESQYRATRTRMTSRGDVHYERSVDILFNYVGYVSPDLEWGRGYRRGEGSLPLLEVEGITVEYRSEGKLLASFTPRSLEEIKFSGSNQRTSKAFLDIPTLKNSIIESLVVPTHEKQRAEWWQSQELRLEISTRNGSYRFSKYFKDAVETLGIRPKDLTGLGSKAKGVKTCETLFVP